MVSRALLVFLSLESLPLFARLDGTFCGTHPERPAQEMFLHRQTVRLKRAAASLSAPALARPDSGDIAIVEDADGVVARRNPFNLAQKTLKFNPSNKEATLYRFTVGDQTYDDAAAANGRQLVDLGDDDTRLVQLPFAFPFYGASYREVYVNSDGNLTFGTGDSSSSDRSLGRLIAGPPRISPLFDDLDPSRNIGSVRVLAESARVVVSWVEVPEYSAFGSGFRQTFQARLYPDGRIEIVFSSVILQSAVVGIAPGNLTGDSRLVTLLLGGLDEEFSGAIAERFTNTEQVDIVTVAQKFYETHEDAYDYLAIFNALGLAADAGVVAYEVTVRNRVTGNGDRPADGGKEYGSPARLQSVLNMGPLNQYPPDPAAFVIARFQQRDTPVTAIAHEAGHRFLAFASIRDPQDPQARPMLGYQGAHWNFVFNSEASLLEGNRIRDNGAGASPRFETIAITEAYSPLDQYLMGFRAPEEVPPTFLVTGTGGQFSTRHQALGVRFDGFRRDVQVDEIIAAEGRRTPDHTVAQRRFRFAFVLVVPPGAPVPAGAVEQLDAYRRAFQDFYGQAASGRAAADTRLRLALDFSAFPAAGVVVGRQMQARLQVKKPVDAPLALTLKSLNGAVAAPAGVTIPSGSSSVIFSLTGMRAGVDEITAEPADSRYDSAVARIQVQAGLEPLQLRVESGDKQGGTAGQPLPLPVVVSVRDVNRLAYSGISLTATPSGGGTVAPQTAATDENGLASFRWTPGAAPSATLAIRFTGVDQGGVDVTSSTGRSFANPVNAASFDATLAPGSIASVFGSNLTSLPAQSAKFPWPLELAGVRVQIGGKPAAILFAGPSQINFLVPDDVPPGPAALTIVSDGQTSTRPGAVLVAPTAPGIFFDIDSGYGAILTAGTSSTTRDRPVAAGDVIEIYATGLGAVAPPDASGLRRTQSVVEATIGDRPAQVLFSGLTPGYLGLYQVNAVVPDGLSPGGQPVSLSVDGVRSNLVSIGVR